MAGKSNPFKEKYGALATFYTTPPTALIKTCAVSKDHWRALALVEGAGGAAAPPRALAGNGPAKAILSGRAAHAIVARGF